MSPKVRAGARPIPDLPRDRLLPEELAEFRRLLGAYETSRERLVAAEAQLSVFLTAARDHRGLAGEVLVDPGTGHIETDLPPERD